MKTSWEGRETINNQSLFVCLSPLEQFFNYLAAVVITGDGAADLDLHGFSAKTV
jgi:hypothetical protein